ncbi:MAG: hypothetical protein KF869_07655 [Phycisphaeraceae bacterium]|nr:hypothetical protein [Phycisphaeraceae bacterium]
MIHEVVEPTKEQRRRVRAFTQWTNKERSQRVVWALLGVGTVCGLFYLYQSMGVCAIVIAPIVLIATYPLSEMIARMWAERSFASDHDLSNILAIGQSVWHGEMEPIGHYDDRSRAEIGEWARALLTDKKWGPVVRKYDWLMELAGQRGNEVYKSGRR